jgi:hypothetical protein
VGFIRTAETRESLLEGHPLRYLPGFLHIIRQHFVQEGIQRTARCGFEAKGAKMISIAFPLDE